MTQQKINKFIIIKKKEPACSASLIPGLERPPGGGHGNPLQYSCLEDPMDKRSLVGYSPCDHKESDTNCSD